MNLNEDQSYVWGLRRRDTRIYEIVFKKYYQPLVVFVVRHVGDEDVAKDIVQDISLNYLKAVVLYPIISS